MYIIMLHTYIKNQGDIFIRLRSEVKRQHISHTGLYIIQSQELSKIKRLKNLRT